MTFQILDYGAVPDGRTNCAQALQAAVDAAAGAGGGRVEIPGGRFLSGSVLLKSNVELHLEAGAELICSLEEKDILPFPSEPGAEPIDGWNGGFFLGARDAENVTISGSGTINGQGKLVFTDQDPAEGFHECPMRAAEFRPRLLLFENVRGLTVRDVTLRDAAFWTLHMAGCRNVRVRDIRILNQDRGANNDGIDPDCCQDVIISGCRIETGDDAIVLKSTAPMARRYGACERIVISGCVLHSRDSALKIGTETWGEIRHVILSDCVVQDCSRAVGIWVRDGGSVEDVLVHHLTGAVRRYADPFSGPDAPGWWGKGEPVFISAVPRRGQEGGTAGVIRGVSFSDIRLKCESSIFLGGDENSRIEDIRFREVHLHWIRQGTQPGGLFDEQPSARHIYSHSIPALYARSVRSLVLRDSSACFTGENEAWDGTLTELEDCVDCRVDWESFREEHAPAGL